VTDEHMPAKRIDPYIVGIGAELDAREWGQIIAAQDPERAVAAISDIDRIARRLITHTLRLSHPGHPDLYLAGSQIDRAHAVITELGDEEALPPQIDRQVIDAAAHFTKQDFGFERER